MRSILSCSESSHKSEQWAVRSRGVLQVRQTAASPRGYRGFRSILMRIMEHNHCGKAAVLFNSHSTENNEKLRWTRAWTGSSSRLSRNSSSRSDLIRDGEWHNAIVLPWSYVIVVEKKRKEKKEEKRRGRDDCFDYRRHWMTKSPVDVRRSARHRLTSAFFRCFTR